MSQLLRKRKATPSPPPFPLQLFESESHFVVSDSLRPHGLYNPWNSPGQNTGVGSLSLLWGIFPTQGLNPVIYLGWIKKKYKNKNKHFFSAQRLFTKTWSPTPSLKPWQSMLVFLPAAGISKINEVRSKEIDLSGTIHPLCCPQLRFSS